MVPEMDFIDCFLSFVFRCLIVSLSGWISMPRSIKYPLCGTNGNGWKTDENQRKATSGLDLGVYTGGLGGPLTESFPQPGVPVDLHPRSKLSSMLMASKPVSSSSLFIQSRSEEAGSNKLSERS